MDYSLKQLQDRYNKTKSQDDFERLIYFKEQEVHTGLVTKHRGGATSPKPDVIGYLLEDQMQADYMTWTRNYRPVVRKSIMHIENEGNIGGMYGAMQGCKSLSKGKLKSVFDNLSVHRGFFLWIELKRVGEDFDDGQLELKALWESWGIKIVKCDNFDTWKFLVDDVIIPCDFSQLENV